MAKVNLRSVAETIPNIDPSYLFQVRQLRELANRDRYGEYELCDDPAAADLIIYVESQTWDSPTGPYFENIRKDTVYRRHREKAFVHSGQDWPVPLVRGVFPSIEKSWHWRSRARSGGYIFPANPYVADFDAVAATVQPRYLASFVGCAGKTPVRHEMLRVKDDSLYIVDNTQAIIGAPRDGNKSDVDRSKREFVEIAAASKFILCPRGYGASSFRLFESMQMGRAPVVISDQWVRPGGIDWDSIVVQIPEGEVMRLATIIKPYESQAAERGRQARLAWEEWFSPSVIFHRICQSCDELRRGLLPEWSTRWLCYSYFLRPFHARKAVRKIKARLRPSSSQSSAIDLRST